MKFQSFFLDANLQWKFSKIIAIKKYFWKFSGFISNTEIVVIQGIFYYPDELAKYLTLTCLSKEQKIATKALYVLRKHLNHHEVAICQSNKKGNIILGNIDGYVTFLFVS